MDCDCPVVQVCSVLKGALWVVVGRDNSSGAGREPSPFGGGGIGRLGSEALVKLLPQVPCEVVLRKWRIHRQRDGN